MGSVDRLLKYMLGSEPRSQWEVLNVLLKRYYKDVMAMRLSDIIVIARRLPPRKRWLFINAIYTLLSRKIGEETSVSFQ